MNFHNLPSGISHGLCAALLSRILRGHLLHRYRGSLALGVLRREYDEAEKMAESTGFPHLVLPVLADERLRLAAKTGKAPGQ
jgi:hypothetical protein